jgi:hypothetical protein
MNRREALSTVALIMGGTIAGAEAFLSGCSAPGESEYIGLLTENGNVRFMDEVAETILPLTENSPGARAAKVGEFMNVMVTECYEPAEQKIFLDGITTLKQVSRDRFGKDFLKLEPEQKHELLLGLEAEAKTYDETRKPEDPETHYYRLMKQLTLVGFLTSEIGVTKAMRHVAVPGRFDPCVPYKPGEKAWA